MGRVRLRAWLWFLLGAALVVLLQLLIIASSHQDTVADPTFAAQLSTILSDGCALPGQALSASLVVVVPPGQVLIEKAVSSWLALRGLKDAVVLHWGSCTTATAVSMLRQVCVPDEAEWHPGRALNLAVSLTSGRLLLVAEPHTWLAPGLLSALLQQRAIVRRRAVAGLLAVPRSLLEAARGWDERATGPPAATGSVAALHEELIVRLKGLQERGADLVSGGAPAEAAAVAVEDVGRHMAKDVREVATAADAESGVEAALGLLAAWHLSRITPSVWRLRRAGGSGMCVAATVRRPPLARELLRHPDETERAALRERIHTASRGAVPWGVLQHTQSLSDLRALEQTWRGDTARDGGAAAAGNGEAEAGGGARGGAGDAAATPPAEEAPPLEVGGGRGGAALPLAAGEVRPASFLLVHVHAALPRRLLALCSARALAVREGRRLAVAWPRDAAVSNVTLSDLFDFSSPSLRDTLDPRMPLPVLSTLLPLHVPASAARFVQRGPPASRRFSPVQITDPEAPVYVKAAAAIEARPPVAAEETRACLQGLLGAPAPASEAQALIRALVPPTATMRAGVHVRRAGSGGTGSDSGDGSDGGGGGGGGGGGDGGGGGGGGGSGGAAGCTPQVFAARLGEMVSESTLGAGSVVVAMDAWEEAGSEAERELPPLFRQGRAPATLSLATARRARCGAAARAGSGGGGGAACEAVTVAEWTLLSRCPALLLSEDAPLSALVAASAPPSAQVWLGCRGSWRRPPDAPQSAERRAAAELAAVRALAEQPAASLRRYVVDEASGLLFCWMPKVACTSFKAWLRRLAGVADPLDLKTLHASTGSGLATLADFSPPERVRLLTSLRRAVFVRDPWTRLLSAYLNKFVEEPEARRRGWLKELLRPLRDGGAARSGARGAAARAAHGALVATTEASPAARRHVARGVRLGRA